MSRQFISVTGSNCTYDRVQLTSSGTLQLEVLQSLFEVDDACGLKYRNENASLNNDEPSYIFVFFDEFSQCFIEPPGGWANKKYEVVYRSDDLEKDKQLRGSDDVGPFLIGTISPLSQDDGAGVWSADGLVGLNLGAVTCHQDSGDTTMNMMVVMEDVIFEIKKLEAKSTLKEKKPAFVIKEDNVVKYKSV
uniref:TAR DNA-binding protein 43 N-terminal domain-containing protein n=1 Tax=Meloidogyne javanica TaxID=6303 RepID=A0A915LJ40_MELJA